MMMDDGRDEVARREDREALRQAQGPERSRGIALYLGVWPRCRRLRAIVVISDAKCETRAKA